MCSTTSMPLIERDFDAYQRCEAIQSPSVCSSRSRAISASPRLTCSGIVAGLLVFDQLEPIEPARAERQQIWQLPDPREARSAKHLDRVAALVLREVELDRLSRTRQVVHAQDEVVLEPPQV